MTRRALLILGVTCCLALMAVFAYSYVRPLKTHGSFGVDRWYDVYLLDGCASIAVWTKLPRQNKTLFDGLTSERRRGPTLWDPAKVMMMAQRNLNKRYHPFPKRPHLYFQVTHRQTGLTITHAAANLTYPAVAASALILMLVVRMIVRQLRLRRETHCRACAYDLTGNVSGRCPECGNITDTTDTGSLVS